MIQRRAVPRHKSFMHGRVLFKHRQSSMDCIIREFTKRGAKLEFSEVPAVPDTFEVYIPGKNEYFQARVVWTMHNEIGVAWEPEGEMASPPSYRSGDPIGDRLAKLEHDVALLRKRLDTMQG